MLIDVGRVWNTLNEVLLMFGWDGRSIHMVWIEICISIVVSGKIWLAVALLWLVVGS